MVSKSVEQPARKADSTIMKLIFFIGGAKLKNPWNMNALIVKPILNLEFCFHHDSGNSDLQICRCEYMQFCDSGFICLCFEKNPVGLIRR